LSSEQSESDEVLKEWWGNEQRDERYQAVCLVASELFNRDITHHGDERGVLSAIINPDNAAPARHSIYLSCIFFPDEAITTDESLTTAAAFASNNSIASGHAFANARYARTFAICVSICSRITDNSACCPDDYSHHARRCPAPR
jgi:hypothetical protein